MRLLFVTWGLDELTGQLLCAKHVGRVAICEKGFGGDEEVVFLR